MAAKKPVKPEIVEKKTIAPEIVLKRGECLVEQLEGKAKGEIFKTNISTAEKLYNDGKKFKIVKKK